ncbi:hypothetical protein [Nannocystis pusilla]|uniref:hypothetical protein n=1 Tax=Nannocystis pusilla TaxID=889268 RepID=UPI003BEF60D7
MDYEKSDGPIATVCVLQRRVDGSFERLGHRSRKQVIAWLTEKHPETGRRLHVVHTALETTKPGAKTRTWKRGAEVTLTHDGEFITTERTPTKRDNLGELPKCTC